MDSARTARCHIWWPTRSVSQHSICDLRDEGNEVGTGSLNSFKQCFVLDVAPLLSQRVSKHSSSQTDHPPPSHETTEEAISAMRTAVKRRSHSHRIEGNRRHRSLPSTTHHIKSRAVERGRNSEIAS
eukprot:gb/GECG01008984.1/.p1 GENE.gb/GECG01008984.1/~~gb/GECG01008984.1/.p1  ORF type:complete len:127 (+),score=9.08 gb/GECG01008984.1/:1-381(+)